MTWDPLEVCPAESELCPVWRGLLQFLAGGGKWVLKLTVTLAFHGHPFRCEPRPEEGIMQVCAIIEPVSPWKVMAGLFVCLNAKLTL